jgi:hypothetical protein
MTNGGLDVESRKLRDACSSKSESILKQFPSDLSSRFKGEQADVFEFLSVLRIDNGHPAKKHIRTVVTEESTRQALSELGLSQDARSDAYECIFNLVYSAALAAGPAQPAWILSSPGALDQEVLVQAEVRKRLITREQVVAALRVASVPAASLLPAPGPATTKLVSKLRAGDVVPTAQAAARRARLAWSSYERGTSPPIPGSAGAPLDFIRLREQLTAEATKAQIAARRNGNPYGDRMLEELQERVSEIARSFPPALGLTTSLLMGLIYDLTAHCEIWWSTEYDVDQEILGSETA